MLMRRVKMACRHTSAQACAEQAVWAQMFGGAKKNRGQDTDGEAPQP